MIQKQTKKGQETQNNGYSKLNQLPASFWTPPTFKVVQGQMSCKCPQYFKPQSKI